MQTAYLILAHHQPNHLARLVRALDAPGCAFFIHIDAKTDETIFKETVEPRNNITARSNITFITDRREVNWAGFSVIEATLALLSEALSFSSSLRRFCLLSGSDFPIKSNAQILADFNSTREFMRVDRKLNSGENQPHNRFVNYYWFMDSGEANWRKHSGKLPRRPYGRIGLYHGSTWWALTRDCIEYILEFVSSNDEYYKFFKNTFCPDELVFHSIVKQSPFASRISHDFEVVSGQGEYFRSNEHGCHYIDWNTPSDTHPKVLDPQDLDKLLGSKALFARKFDELRSGALIAMLEDALTSTPPVP
ncbi:MAG TPA: beta-1,6-N-acetylglucosaminyltransferase [Bryobacteraceae bacterium]|nr:beta-1,6-N-acetylglucosaminyltransferase [Bryobacteraceae bacterium]